MPPTNFEKSKTSILPASSAEILYSNAPSYATTNDISKAPMRGTIS
jgi:hypothetical protein